MNYMILCEKIKYDKTKTMKNRKPKICDFRIGIFGVILVLAINIAVITQLHVSILLK